MAPEKKTSDPPGNKEKGGAAPPESAGPVREAEEMTFLEHLEELRRVLLKSFTALMISCAVVMAGLKYFSGLLHWPLRFALGGKEDLMQGLVTTSPMGVFSVLLQVSFFGGFALALPFMLYFAARFVAPGLTRKELAVLRPGCALAFFLFAAGALFSFFVLVPAALKASIFFNQLLGFELIWMADRYYGMLLWMTLGIGLSFEFPLVIVLLVYLGIIHTTQLRAFRIYSIVLFLVLAAVVTPTTDPFTFLLLALPMSLLYEISLGLSRRMEKRKKKEA